MTAWRRWWLRRRHGAGEWSFLLEAPPANEWVSLDLETTGLDPASDHILSLAAVPVRGGRLLLSERFERQIRPDREFDIDSMRHHRILPEEAAGGMSVTPAVREFLHWLGSRRLLGYHLAFDLAMLAPHVRGLTGFALPNPWSDLADDVAEHEYLLHPEVPPKLDFEHIAAQLGVPVLDRHTALGDAITTALCWLALHGKGEKPR